MKVLSPTTNCVFIKTIMLLVIQFMISDSVMCFSLSVKYMADTNILIQLYTQLIVNFS